MNIQSLYDCFLNVWIWITWKEKARQSNRRTEEAFETFCQPVCLQTYLCMDVEWWTLFSRSQCFRMGQHSSQQWKTVTGTSIPKLCQNILNIHALQKRPIQYTEISTVSGRPCGMYIHCLLVPTSLSSAQELHKFAGQGELNSQRISLWMVLWLLLTLLTTPTPTCWNPGARCWRMSTRRRCPLSRRRSKEQRATSAHIEKTIMSC